ncbi:MAG: sodium:solute symporter [Phycisphaerae bacterium]|nr:sodium:solute symporter [Phycisphaerae bacterium]
MEYLSKLDYGIIAAYFVVLIGLGFYLQRLASQSMESYFLAGRRLPWWMLGVSGMGYSLDIAGTMLIVSLLYLLGPRGLFIEFRGGLSLALICQMIWTGKWHRRSGCMTVAEWMSFRFGKGRTADFARIATALSFITFTIAMLTYMAVGVGQFLSLFIPLPPSQCALILLGVATLYTALSGLYGVVYSDLFQCGLILFGVVVVIVLAVSRVPDADSFAAMAEKVSHMANWTTSFPQAEAAMPKGYEQYKQLLLYTMFFLVLNKLIIGGFGTGHEPQFFAARNERECGKLSCLWAILMTFRWPMMIGYAILGIYLVQDFFPDQHVLSQAAVLIKEHVAVGEAQWREVLAQIKQSPGNYPAELVFGLKSLMGENWYQKLDLVSFAGTVNAERIMPSVLLYRIPTGFRGLILVTLIAACMSTFDMTMNKSSAMFTNDIYRRYLRPAAKNRELLTATYAFCVIVVAVGFVLAYCTRDINSIWGWITMGLWSGIGMPLLLRFYWWRFNGAGYAAGMAGGLLAAIVVLVIDTFHVDLSEVTQFLILTPISLLCAIVGTYLGPPCRPEVLENFYRTTRPFGFWGPLRNTLSEKARHAMEIEHLNDYLALPCAFVWMVTMYLLPMQLMLRQYQAFGVTLVLFLTSLAGMYRFWYKNLPSQSEAADLPDARRQTDVQSPDPGRADR